MEIVGELASAPRSIGQQTMSLCESLAAVSAEIERVVPAEGRKVMERATEELRASGILEGVKKMGERAPDLALSDENGQIVTLAERLKQGPVALVFQRGSWCPYCNAEFAALQRVKAQIEAAGASLVAVSPQLPAFSRKAKEDNSLAFPILNDSGNRAAETYGLKFALHPMVRPIYQALGIDLAVFNGDDAWTLPMPARFIVRPDGVIAFAESGPDCAVRPEPEDLVAALIKLRETPPAPPAVRTSFFSSLFASFGGRRSN